MWIVRVALNRPYTFIVLALLIFILGPVPILNTPTDIFPNINIRGWRAPQAFGGRWMGPRHQSHA
jgi:multidrug efflux pump subunit AcrB